MRTDTQSKQAYSCDLTMNPPCFQDELLSKKKKEKKKKLSSRPAEDLRCIGQDRTDRYSHDIITGLLIFLVCLCLLFVVCLFLVSEFRTDLTGRTSSL